MQTPHQILKQFWGYDSFRPLQEEIVQSVLDGRDTLALLPTGGGKSICFQVPGLALPGLTLVISPLIALMRDQVQQLNARHIPATFVNSTQRYGQIDRKLQMAMDGKYKFLYIAPERLRTDLFLARLQQLNVSLLAVDEAHCISQWGYDFRPAYLQIHELREQLPGVPVIALTATAPPQVRKDIVEKLALHDPAVFTKSFRRDNLSYRVINSERVPDRILEMLQNTPGSGIIYARTRKRVVALADLLKREGMTAEAYHGGLPHATRNEVQQQWIRNEVRVITATNAFGMGIDKPDVRFVIHYNLPSDPESYYQEAGRGGRDGAPAIALAFENPRDIQELERWVREKYPSWEQLKGHYEVLANAYGLPTTGVPTKAFPFDLADIARRFNVHPIRFYNSLGILQREGLLMLQEQPEDFGVLRVTVRPRDVLSYKERFPDHAHLIDFVLRSLGGEAYTTFMRFSVAVWARKLEWEESDLDAKLRQLAVRKIISYRPPSTEPSIRFFKPRIRLNKQLMNWDRYTFLRERGVERLEVLLSYAKSPAKKCRSRMLEEYFGERGNADCGVCDYCREKAAGAMGASGKQGIALEMWNLLSGGPLEMRMLLGKLKHGNPKQRLEVMRELLDQRKLERVGGTQVRRSDLP